MTLMRRGVCLSVGYLLCFGFSSANASIEFSPAVSFSQYWTDNRALSVDALREGDAITEVTPEISVTMTSRRHSGTLEARLQHLIYRRADETRNFQQYRASTSSELLSDLFFLDFSADRVQSAISQQNAVAANNLSLTDNRTDTTTFGVNPYLLKQWNSRWRSRIDYEYRDINFATQALNDSQLQEVTLLTSYGSGGDTISIDLSYNGIRTESERTTTPAEFDEVRLDSRYRMSSRWTWLLNVGYEEDRYDRTTAEETKGGFGEAGFEVRPTQKITINALMGERYFGNTASLRLLYRYNLQTGVEASYRTDITQQAIEINRSNVPTGVITQFDRLGDTYLETEVFKTRQSNVRTYYQWAKSRGELSANREVRDFQLSLRQETIDSVEASWNWSITARSTLDFVLSVRDREVDNQPGNDRLDYASLKIENQARKNIVVGADYSVTSRSGDVVQEYRQQQIGIFVRLLFSGRI